jgi:hypothetical protein
MTNSTRLDPELWGEAYARVEHLLLAYRVTNRFLLAQLSGLILSSAAQRHAAEPDRPRADIAAEEAVRLIGDWIDALIGPSSDSRARRFALGRAAIFLADLPTRWPASFLNFRDPPPEVLERLRTTYLAAGPDLDFSNMGPRPIDLGPISYAAGETWRKFAKWPALRGAFIWSLFLGLLGTAFFLTRF